MWWVGDDKSDRELVMTNAYREVGYGTCANSTKCICMVGVGAFPTATQLACSDVRIVPAAQLPRAVDRLVAVLRRNKRACNSRNTAWRRRKLLLLCVRRWQKLSERRREQQALRDALLASTLDLPEELFQRVVMCL